MELAEFSVPPLEEDDRIDLGMALNGLSGVAAIDFSDRSVRVLYDPMFADRDVIERAIAGSGYLVGEAAG